MGKRWVVLEVKSEVVLDVPLIMQLLTTMQPPTNQHPPICTAFQELAHIATDRATCRDKMIKLFDLANSDVSFTMLPNMSTAAPSVPQEKAEAPPNKPPPSESTTPMPLH